MRRPLKRHEFERLVELGAFADERVELIFGELITMSPPGALHLYYSVWLLNQLFARLQGRACVQGHSPIRGADESEPEPDVCVYPTAEHRPDRLPEHCYLVVEVADSSRAFDLGTKARLYARTGVPAYWCVDVRRNAVIVHSDPTFVEYGTVATVAQGEGAILTLPAFPDVVIEVDALFGRRPTP